MRSQPDIEYKRLIWKHPLNFMMCHTYEIEMTYKNMAEVTKETHYIEKLLNRISKKPIGSLNSYNVSHSVHLR